MVPKYTEYFLVQRIAKHNRPTDHARVVYIADDALRHQPMEAGHMTVLVLQAYWIRILPCCYI